MDTGLRSSIAGFLTLLALAGAAPAAEPVTPAIAADRYEDARALVLKLGDERFATRESATNRLIEMGLAAEKSLTEGCEHADREIRYRCQRILSIVGETDFERRLAAFEAGRDGAECRLGGWQRFRELYGAEATARALFAEMQRAERKIMEATGGPPAGLAKSVEVRCAGLQQMANRQLSLGTVAALLFAATSLESPLPMTAQQALTNFCLHQSVTDAMNDVAKAKLVRPMLSNWVKRGEGSTAYQNISLAIRYDLKEGLVPAAKLIQTPANQPYMRMTGVQAVVKLGDESHVPLLEGLLDDTSRCSSHRGEKNISYETQLRDVALVAILLLQKRDPKQFGFTRFQPQPQASINISTIGFENDEKRNQAFAKWHAFKKQEKPHEK